MSDAMLSRHFRWLTPRVARLLGLSVFIMITGNGMLMGKLLKAYPLQWGNVGFITSVFVLFGAATALLLLCVVAGRRLYPLLAGWFLVSSAVCAYFMDRYGTVIDITMLESTLQTDVAEAGDLLDWPFLARVVALGIAPAVWLYRRPAASMGFAAEMKSRLLTGLLLIVLMLLCIAPYTSRYATFIREHKPVRYYANPTYPTWSLVSLIRKQLELPASTELQSIAQDARLTDARHDIERKELIILVVGETARADRFAVNGYHRDTNPELMREGVSSFRKVTSCGTSTAVSVPCMFSGMEADAFSLADAGKRENVLDVLKRNGVEILWRDNNSDSKGVALRVPFEDFKSPQVNPVCDTECRDGGMLPGLDEWIARHKDKDLLIVLHQMGNHGPAYYKRYPQAFEFFKPVCKTSELSACTKEELDNAYDNAIRYTDHFLGQVIRLLKRHDETHATAMLYVSDHGESLGENGLYLHGAPKVIAPKEQTHVAAIAWTGKYFDWPVAALRTFINEPLSHSDLFCTLLAGFEVEASQCKGKR